MIVDIVVYYPMRLAPRRVTGGMSDAHQRGESPLKPPSLPRSQQPLDRLALLLLLLLLFDLRFFFFFLTRRWSTPSLMTDCCFFVLLIQPWIW